MYFDKAEGSASHLGDKSVSDKHHARIIDKTAQNLLQLRMDIH